VEINWDRLKSCGTAGKPGGKRRKQTSIFIPEVSRLLDSGPKFTKFKLPAPNCQIVKKKKPDQGFRAVQLLVYSISIVPV
jgi:hypothetical protein